MYVKLQKKHALGKFQHCTVMKTETELLDSIKDFKKIN